MSWHLSSVAMLAKALEAKRLAEEALVNKSSQLDYAKAQAELAEARTALADRQTIDRAKAILMKRKGLDEPAAYALLRNHAMRSNRRISEVAEAIVTSEALMGDME